MDNFVKECHDNIDKFKIIIVGWLVMVERWYLLEILKTRDFFGFPTKSKICFYPRLLSFYYKSSLTLANLSMKAKLTHSRIYNRYNLTYYEIRHRYILIYA